MGKTHAIDYACLDLGRTRPEVLTVPMSCEHHRPDFEGPFFSALLIAAGATGQVLKTSITNKRHEDFATIPHRRYSAAGDRPSRGRLIVSAAGLAATTIFLDWREGGRGDIERSWNRLEALCADAPTARRLILNARDQAHALMPTMRAAIFSVAQAPRERRTLSQNEIEESFQNEHDASDEC